MSGTKMYGPILLLAAFFGSVVLMMVMITPVIFASIDPGEATTANRISEVFENLVLTAWEPNPYEVTGASVDEGTSLSVDVAVTFDQPGGGDFPMECGLVRNQSWPFDKETGDYWVFNQRYGWFGLEVAEKRVSLDTIRNAYDPASNYSKIIVSLRYTVSVFFWVNDGYLPDLLDLNSYNVTAGIGLNDSMTSISPWTMLGKLMTFRMPGANLFTNALIAIPIYTVLIYIAFEIIRSCIPLLGG